jgi:hypothetical protein
LQGSPNRAIHHDEASPAGCRRSTVTVAESTGFMNPWFPRAGEQRGAEQSKFAEIPARHFTNKKSIKNKQLD